MVAHREGPPPLIHGFLRQARRAHGALSQHDVAGCVGVSTRLYQGWESGVRSIPVHRLDALATALGLDAERRDELWVIASGDFPPRGPGRPDPGAVSGWTSYLRLLPVPALAVDAGWRIEESNTAWQGLFLAAGQPAPANLLRFVLFSPYARRLCGDWAAGWATPFLRQLRLEAETRRSPELRAVVAEIAGRDDADPELAALWRGVHTSSRVALHDDGQVRLLVPPAGGPPSYVRTLVSSPAHDPRRRIVTFLPTTRAADAA
ncbi:helix-turn-helix domain-containing protein [Streptomyces sp. NRRL F-5123]|uniref:MmyB family transcriptional regulator n=1 Tax=Streptomyces sp. NRRL F-5123 TaxID=1463856 RepID=UPI0004E25F31|nr:helix-turn-helix domain-containing protein [Streptomyces sp. NRRL F-5123]